MMDLTMNILLTGKNALVCGASRGIGLAIAKKLSSAGANVTLLSRDEKALLDAKKQLNISNGQSHQILVSNSAEPVKLTETIKAYLAENSSFDILVNNTGGPAPGPAHNALNEDYLQAFNQHLIANQSLVKTLLPGMQAKKSGRIINIISTSVKQPIPNLGISNTIRGAVASWSKTLSNELGPYNITVNNILPGATNTERLAQIIANKAKKTNKTIEQVREHEISLIPLGRFCEPEELADLALFLASPLASYITGVSIAVDGGRTQCL